MNHLRSIWQALKLFFTAAVCWAALCGWALAQPDTGENKGGGATSWTTSYFLVVLAVGLGLLVVLRSSRRRDRAKPQAYVKMNLIGEDEEESD